MKTPTTLSRIIAASKNRVGVVLFALAAIVILCPTDRAIAESPRPLGALLPSGAVTALVTDDLRALLKQWQSSALRKDWNKSAAAKQLVKSRVYLRLERNLSEIEDLAGTSVTLDKLVDIAGHRSILGLYHVPTTSFVLVSELAPEEAKAFDYLGQKGRAQPREHRGVPYLIEEGARGKASLAVALVGNRLIAGTDLVAFRGALVLAAKSAGVAVKPPEAGQPADAPTLADDPRWKALAQAAPPEAPVSVWVAGEALSGHYFDDFWLFGKETAAGVSAAWLTLAPSSDVTIESRTYLYAEGARPAVGADEGARIGTSDVVAKTAALPATPPFASAHPIDAAGAAQLLDELLPIAHGEDDKSVDNDASARRKLFAEALAPAQPRRVVELLTPQVATKTTHAESHAAVAIALGKPAAFDAAKLEKALLGALAPSLGGADLAFHDEPGARALRLPLVNEWSLTIAIADGKLIFASDPQAAQDLKAAIGKPEAAALLAEGAPRLWRLDVDRAKDLWQSTNKVLAARSNWRDPADTDLFGKSIGGLFTVGRDVHKVVAYGYAKGPRFYVEEVQYRGR